MSKIHYISLEDYKAGYERVICMRDMYDTNFTLYKKEVTCKECLKKLNKNEQRRESKKNT